MASKETIKRVLTLLCENHRRKYTATLEEVWVMALENVPDKTANVGLKWFIQNGNTKGFMPTTDQFLKECRELLQKTLKEKRLQQEIAEQTAMPQTKAIDYKEYVEKAFPSTKEKVSLMEQKEKRRSVSDLGIVEYYSQEGRLKYLMCYEHIDKKLFLESCWVHFQQKPFNVSYEFGEDRKIPNRDKNGNVETVTDKFCKSNVGKPVTVGYV